MPFYLLFLLPMFLVNCSSQKMDPTPPRSSEDRERTSFGSLVGRDVLTFSFGASKEAGAIGSSVNPHLWRSSLEILAPIPLISSDANGGVLITDWVIDSQNPKKRIKITTRIHNSSLRADSLSVLVHKQIKEKMNEWGPSSVDSTTAREIETLILTRAREIKLEGPKF